MPYPPPGDLPDPGVKSASLTSPALAGGLFTTRATWEADTSYLLLAPYFEFSLYHTFFFFWLFPTSHVLPFVNVVTFYLLYFSSHDLKVTNSISILLAFLSMRQKNICEPVSSFFFG